MHVDSDGGVDQRPAVTEMLGEGRGAHQLSHVAREQFEQCKLLSAQHDGFAADSYARITWGENQLADANRITVGLGHGETSGYCAHEIPCAWRWPILVHAFRVVTRKAHLPLHIMSNLASPRSAAPQGDCGRWAFLYLSRRF